MTADYDLCVGVMIAFLMQTGSHGHIKRSFRYFPPGVLMQILLYILCLSLRCLNLMSGPSNEKFVCLDLSWKSPLAFQDLCIYLVVILCLKSPSLLMSDCVLARKRLGRASLYKAAVH